jgi:hypothetical protein
VCQKIKVYKVLVGKSERDSSENIDLGWQIILKWEGMEWIHVTQDRDNWRIFVTTVMNPKFQKCREFQD